MLLENLSLLLDGLRIKKFIKRSIHLAVLND